MRKDLGPTPKHHPFNNKVYEIYMMVYDMRCKGYFLVQNLWLHNGNRLLEGQKGILNGALTYGQLQRPTQRQTNKCQ